MGVLIAHDVRNMLVPRLTECYLDVHAGDVYHWPALAAQSS